MFYSFIVAVATHTTITGIFLCRRQFRRILRDTLDITNIKKKYFCIYDLVDGSFKICFTDLPASEFECVDTRPKDPNSQGVPEEVVGHVTYTVCLSTIHLPAVEM